ncbi:MAG: SRPBCC domain-containing protein [candidate division KSB1 bacterium]|nr:SRPBCC domain-containing protein [candidate division KSB1 bacterium]MDZ7302364.1 SRPBCC domain-containing protein [candidate division KSB1 bacterium]MDZ7311216.1 SRPBCC domain-containing protein [candidate division KSB1 bacterium]
MNKLYFSIVINAPKEKVWNTMLDDKSYRVWTEAFNPGSHYVGDWSKGSKILFLGPDPNTGKMGGMVSRIKENRLHEYISIEHLGMVQDGVEDTTSDAVKAWAGAHENYTFKEQNGKTEVLVEMDSPGGEFEEMFKDMWPKALQKLKELAEK